MVDVNQVVRETMSLRAYEQRVSNIVVIDALAAGLPQVFADPHQVKQVLLNLVINAEQAMLSTHGRGSLVMRTWHDAEADAVMLEVSDDGPGVPDDVQGRIFDPFFTTKQVGKGTGLGLTVAYAIMQEHGGRITVHSEPDHGATFRLEFPATIGTIQTAGADAGCRAGRYWRGRPRAPRRRRAGARHGGGRGPDRRRISSRSRGKRRGGTRLRASAQLRPRDL